MVNCQEARGSDDGKKNYLAQMSNLFIFGAPLPLHSASFWPTNLRKILSLHFSLHLKKEEPTQVSASFGSFFLLPACHHRIGTNTTQAAACASMDIRLGFRNNSQRIMCFSFYFLPHVLSMRSL